MAVESFRKKVFYYLQLIFEWFREKKECESEGVEWGGEAEERERREKESGVRKRGKMTKINLGERLIYGSSLYYLCNFSIGLKFFKRKKSVLSCWWEAFLPTLTIEILDKLDFFKSLYKFKSKKRKYTDTINQEETRPQQRVRTKWWQSTGDTKPSGLGFES